MERARVWLRRGIVWGVVIGLVRWLAGVYFWIGAELER
jgi:hypothetical protein